MVVFSQGGLIVSPVQAPESFPPNVYAPIVAHGVVLFAYTEGLHPTPVC